jgi:hypothetical protein
MSPSKNFFMPYYDAKSCLRITCCLPFRQPFPNSRTLRRFGPLRHRLPVPFRGVAGEFGCRLHFITPSPQLLAVIVVVMVMVVMMVGVNDHNHLGLRSNRDNCEGESKNQSEQKLFHALVSQPVQFRAELL